MTLLIKEKGLDKRKHRKIDYFKKQYEILYGEGHFLFLCHAAFPVMFTPDMLYRMWLNFGIIQSNENKLTYHVNQIVVSDIILSNISIEIGYELYEFDKEIRTYLLSELEQNFGKQYLKIIATFLYKYAEIYYKHPSEQHYKDTHQWTAQVVINPQLAVKSIGNALAGAIEKGRTGEQIRIFMLLDQFAKDEKAFEQLFEFSKGVTKHIYGNKDYTIKLPVLTTEPSETGIEILKLPIPESLKGKIEKKVSQKKNTNKGYMIALQRIEEAYNKNETELSLNSLSLTEVPPEIGKLQKLKVLHLRDNKLTSLPNEMKDLFSLKQIGFSKNEFTSFPNVLLSLNNLEGIYFGDNKIKELPYEITNLNKLKQVKCGDNPLEKPPYEIIIQGIKAIQNYFKSENTTKNRRKPTSAEIKFLRLIGSSKRNDIILRKVKEDWDLLEFYNSGLLSKSEMDAIQTIIDKETSVEEHLHNIENGEYIIKDGKYVNDRINFLLENDIITIRNLHDGLHRGIETNAYNIDNLIAYEIIKEEEVDYIIPVESHLENIRNKKYDNLKIKELIDKKIIDILNLEQCGFTSDEINLIIYGFLSPLRLPDLEYSNIPSPVSGRTDIFIFGTVASGKSCFLAGLLYYAYKMGLSILKTDLDYQASRIYYNLLIKSIAETRLIERNFSRDFQYFNVDFMDNSQRIRPLTFHELSGELFNSFHHGFFNEQSYFNIIRQHIFDNSNPKIMFFIFDVDALIKNERDHEWMAMDRFIRLLDLLERYDTLKYIENIVILLTKWDIVEKSNKNILNETEKYTPNEFIEDHLLALITRIKVLAEYQKKPFSGNRLEYKIMTFSLGEFSDDNLRYTYNPIDSENIYKYICNITATSNSKKKTIWDIFRKKG